MMTMSDFFMYVARLEQNHLEYTALNAITRMIAERVGYVVKPRFLQAPTQWQLLTPQGGQIVFKSKGTDVDAAWSTARLKKLIPEYALSVDAALTLPLPGDLFLEITTPLSGDVGDIYIVEVCSDSTNARLVSGSKYLANAICSAWWQIVTKEVMSEHPVIA